MGKAIEDIAGCEVFLKAVETLKATKRLRVIENDHEGQETTSLGFVIWLRYFRENVTSSFQIQRRIDTTSPHSSEFKFNPFWHIQICTHIWAWLNECKLKNVNGVGGGVEGQGHGSGGRLLSHWGEWLSNCGLTHPPTSQSHQFANRTKENLTQLISWDPLWTLLLTQLLGWMVSLGSARISYFPNINIFVIVQNKNVLRRGRQCFLMWL